MALDWYKKNNGVFGIYKGYFFNIWDASIFSNPQYKYVSATTRTLTEELKARIKSELESNRKALKYSSFEIRNNSVFFEFIENLSLTKLSTVYSLLDYLVDLFKQLNLPEQNMCHNCGAKDNLQFYNLNDNGAILCNTCFRQLDNRFGEIQGNRISEEKKYLNGFTGSILFSIPGIMAWILLAVYAERLASGMALIIAFLGIKGYEYFKGRQGKLTKYIIVLSNIACIIIANVMTTIILMMKGGITLNQAFLELQINEDAKDFLFKNMMISFVLAFFIWIWLLFILKDKPSAVHPAHKILKTII